MSASIRRIVSTSQKTTDWRFQLGEEKQRRSSNVVERVDTVSRSSWPLCAGHQCLRRCLDERSLGVIVESRLNVMTRCPEFKIEDDI